MGNEESGNIGDHLFLRNHSHNDFRNQFSYHPGTQDLQFQFADFSQFSSSKQDIYALGILVLELLVSVYIPPETAIKA